MGYGRIDIDHTFPRARRRATAAFVHLVVSLTNALGAMLSDTSGCDAVRF